MMAPAAAEDGKVRIALDLTPEAVKQLDEQQKLAGVPTRAAYIRNAMKLYAWFLEQRSQGFEVVLRHEKTGDERIVELFL